MKKKKINMLIVRLETVLATIQKEGKAKKKKGHFLITLDFNNKGLRKKDRFRQNFLLFVPLFAALPQLKTSSQSRRHSQGFIRRSLPF